MRKILLYKEDDGTVPLLEWFDGLPDKVLDKCTAKIERLEEKGHKLRRPEADYLRDGIYELRIRFQNVNYRILYFFHERIAVMLSHGLTKEKKVPPKEIDLAVRRKKKFEKAPDQYGYEE
ncbi:MAG: type II toxin-antitoxin system RelE/ParE family toxin [Candidatus Omnitrophica bacterium]|nr:type II toxin-antitoxin system RelE/ParE family toxin [Candidatus Omnitrophota bacterium]